MGKHLIVASSNKNKMIEIKSILKDLDVEILSMQEAGIDVEIIENGKSFEENAAIKAMTVAKAAGEMAIADDSGLVIDALDGAPGIYSARFMGHDTSYDLKNDELIRRVNAYCREKEAERADAAASDPDRPGAEADGTPGPERSARFVCAVAAAWPDGKTVSAKGVLEGRIAYERRGSNGFGYDPIFFLPSYKMTSAQITADEKNRISHRGQAFRAMHELLEKELGTAEQPQNIFD